MRTRAAVVVVLCGLLAGCDGATGPSASSAPDSPTPAIALATASPTAPAVATPGPTPRPTPLAVPQPPKGVKLTDMLMGRDGARRTTTISWKSPRTKGTEIRVYGVTACFAPPTGGPCLVEHTPLPASVRNLIAKASASKGEVSWTWPNWEDIGGAVMAHGSSTYQAVVVAAYNEAGHSKFIIVASGDFCPGCTY